MVETRAGAKPVTRLAISPRAGSVLLPLIAALALSLSAALRAADRSPAAPSRGPGLAFTRYVAGAGHARFWTTENLEIDASLPRQGKRGWLRAIRRLPPFGQPEYQVLELSGDPSIRRQVIARYLSADKTAASMPASAVAITPANYQFHYKGAVNAGGATAYVFQIKPRKKREGLVKGELWIDAESGAAVRVAGYLVKSSSIFVKRISLVRETTFLDGMPAGRVTYLSVDTRLIGVAELTIKEAPRPALDDTGDEYEKH